MFRCLLCSNLYFDGAKVITRCVHKRWCQWLETITWKFGYELSLHFHSYLPAERTLALDNFGNFVSFDYPVLSSDFGSGCCNSWMACLMRTDTQLSGGRRAACCPSYDTMNGLTRPPTQMMPLSSTNGLK